MATLIDTEKLKKQLMDIAATVKDGESKIVPFSYMYGDPIEFVIKRQGSKLSIDPQFEFVSMSDQKALEEPVKQVIDNVIKNQEPVYKQASGQAKGFSNQFGMFALGAKTELQSQPRPASNPTKK